MACNITLNENNIQHILPAAFLGGAGVGWGGVDDPLGSAMYPLIKGLKYEIMRDSMSINNPWVPSDPNNAHINRRNMRGLVRKLRQEGEGTKLYWSGGAAPPSTLPNTSGVNSPYSINNNIATDNWSPANAAAWMEYFLADPDFGPGSVHSYEHLNEYATNSSYSVNPPLNRNIYNLSTVPDYSQQTVYWGISTMEKYNAAIKAVDPSIITYGGSFASSAVYYMTSQIGYAIDPVANMPATIGGVGKPYASTAEWWAHTDSHSQHIYGGNFTGTQCYFNGMYYPSWDGVTGSTTPNKSNYLGALRLARSKMVAAGLSDKAQGMTEMEFGADKSSSTAYVAAGLDAAIAIISCRHQDEFKLDQHNHFALYTSHQNVYDPRNDWIIYWDGNAPPYTYSKGVRYYMCQRMMAPYIRNYKKQLIGHQNMNTVVVNGANTPGGANANAVPRIACVAGLNADESKMAIWIQNVDLSNSETVNITWTRPASGNLTGYKMTPGIAYQNEDFTPVNITPNTSTSATITVPAGQTILMEVTIGPGTPPPPPTLGSTSVWLPAHPHTPGGSSF